MRLTRVFKRKCVQIYGSCNTCHPCPDMFVGLINLNHGKFYSILKPYRTLQKCDLPLIVMVLESPHKQEYSTKGFPIRPARGRTGENIKLNLVNHLKNKIPSGWYKILLVEAISYQCSNGKCLNNNGKNKKRRDNLFRIMWLCGGMRFFEKRLLSYRPKIIINSCTGGSDGMKSDAGALFLNSLVQKSINKICLDSQKFYSSHPSSKWFKNIGNLKEIKL